VTYRAPQAKTFANLQVDVDDDEEDGFAKLSNQDDDNIQFLTANGELTTSGFAVDDFVYYTVDDPTKAIGGLRNGTVYRVYDLIGSDDSVQLSAYRQGTVSFNENGGSADTITRSSGDWTHEGFAIDQDITVTGAGGNNGTYTITNISALTITIEAGDLSADAANVAGVEIQSDEIELTTDKSRPPPPASNPLLSATPQPDQGQRPADDGRRCQRRRQDFLRHQHRRQHLPAGGDAGRCPGRRSGRA